MKNATKLGALALASVVALAPALMAPAQAATCTKKATVTMLGTIKPEIQDQFLAAVED